LGKGRQDDAVSPAKAGIGCFGSLDGSDQQGRGWQKRGMRIEHQ